MSMEQNAIQLTARAHAQNYPALAKLDGRAILAKYHAQATSGDRIAGVNACAKIMANVTGKTFKLMTQ